MNRSGGSSRQSVGFSVFKMLEIPRRKNLKTTQLLSRYLEQDKHNRDHGALQMSHEQPIAHILSAFPDFRELLSSCAARSVRPEAPFVDSIPKDTTRILIHHTP
jgi:hypothetical protein